MSILAKRVQKKTSLTKTVFKNQVTPKKTVDQSRPVQDILNLHKSIGNKGVQRLFESGFIQGKLPVRKPDKKYVQEAVYVVDEVMRIPKLKIQKQNENKERKKTTVQTEPKNKKEQVQARVEGKQLFTITPDIKDKNTSVNLPKEKQKPTVPAFSKDRSEAQKTKGSMQRAQVEDAAKASEKTELTRTPLNQYEDKETKKETVQTETKEKPVSINGAHNLFKVSTELSSKVKNTSENPPKEKPKLTVPVPSTVKESIQETQVNDAEDAGKKTKTVKTPLKPSEDIAFQSVIKQIKRTGKIQKAHPTPKNKLTEVKQASYLPKEEQQKNLDESDHFRIIEQTSENAGQKKFTPDTFKALLKNDLDNLKKSLPKDKEGAENFKKSKPLKSLKENISTNVNKEKENIAGPLAKDAKVKNPPKSPSAPIISKPVPKVSAGTAPRPVNKKAAAPKPLNKTEVSMEKESRSLDDLMKENDLSESQLANSNEPAFLKALNTKTKAQKEARQAPMIYRDQEGRILANARHQAAVSGKQGLHAMFASRVGTFTNVFKQQTSTEKADKNEQKRINAEFEKIYNKTKKSVADKLDGISKKVNEYFTDGGLVDKAKKTFEKNVEDKLDDIISWTDIFFGKDTKAIEKVFVTEKNRFITTLNAVFDKIAVIISDGLNEAIKIIDDGRKRTKEFYDGLDKKQKELGKDALDTFNDKYDTLEESVNAKEKELAHTLAKQYQKNANSLRKTFEGIKKKVSTSWLDGAINSIKGVIETVKKLKKLITTLLTEIRAFVPKIMADPVGFAKQLFGGIKEGIGLFKANIKKHLIGGFVKWLTGAMGPIGITIPDNLFSLKGIFNLVMQILGLGWDYLRKKAVKMLGEPIVKAMETGVKIFQIIRKKGVAGIWEYLKEKFNDLKETVIGAIKEMIITKVIVAGIKWLVSLLIPGAGFIKAVLAIKDIIVFFVESAIMLIPTLIESIKALASGSVKMVAKAVEKGLSLLVSLVINLFAKLIGLGGLAKKVMGIIKRIRKRIDKAIDRLILKARKAFKGLVKTGKAKVKSVVKGLIQWWKAKKKFKTIDGKSHKLYFEGSGKRAKLIRASRTHKELDDYLAALDIKHNDKNYHKLKKAKDLSKNIRLIIRTSTKNSVTDTTVSKTEKDIVKNMTKLSNLLVDLVGLKPADVPSNANWTYAGSKRGKHVSVEHLSYKTATGGKGATGDTPEHIMKFLKGKGWVRMHLITASVGGRGTSDNWVPAPSGINTGGAVLHSFEKSLDRIVRSKEIPASSGVRYKPARKVTSNVVWVDVKVLSHYPPNPLYNNFTGFVEKILFKFGIYFPPKPGEKEWKKVPKALSGQLLTIPSPPIGNEIILNSDSIGRTDMRKTGFSHFIDDNYGKKLIDDIKESRPFNSWDELEEKLKIKVKKARKLISGYDENKVKIIIKDLKNNSTIKLQ